MVFVELQEHGVAGPSHTFELTLTGDCPDKSDLGLVVDGMIFKKPSMQDVLRNGKLTLKVASAHFPNRYVDVGEKSPIKHGSSLQCFYTRPKPPQLVLPGRVLTSQQGKHSKMLSVENDI